MDRLRRRKLVRKRALQVSNEEWNRWRCWHLADHVKTQMELRPMFDMVAQALGIPRSFF
jgi:hypothetical protein